MKSQNLHLNRKCLAACNQPGRAWQGSLAVVKHQRGAGKQNSRQPEQTLPCSLAPSATLQGGDMALGHTLTILQPIPDPLCWGLTPGCLCVWPALAVLCWPCLCHILHSVTSRSSGAAWEPGRGSQGRAQEGEV